MAQKNMLTKDDLLKIEQLFDKKFDERFNEEFDKRFDAKFQEYANLIINKIYEIVEPMAQDVHDLKNDMKFVKEQIVLLNDNNALIHKRINLLEKKIS